MSTIIKSDNDSRNYRMIVLNNGMQLVLVSSLKENYANNVDATNSIEGEDENDTDTTRSDEKSGSGDSGSDESDDSDEESSCNEKLSSAALTIGVGSFLDPEDVPGLAHLVEHMVFMGSEKYPKENAFDEYVNKHGGYNNAHTDMEETTFELEINKKYFEKSLDMFANFFIKPLMLKDSLDREIEAVDSEFKLGIPKDYIRLNFLLTKLAKPGHPLSKFSWGNNNSLKIEPQLKNIDVYQHLHEFKDEYYKAQLMTLAVQSMDSLDNLEVMVRRIFGDVPSSDLQRPSFEGLTKPFDTDLFNKLYKVLPVEAQHKIVLTWSLPSLVKEYKSKPLKLIQYIVEHEGKGGLVAYLRHKHWVLNITAGNSGDGFENNSTHSSFEISIYVTDLGMENIYEILTSTFQYLKMISLSDLSKFFKETQLIKAYSFNYEDEEQTSTFVEQLAQNLQIYPPEHVLTGPELFFVYDEKLLTEYLGLLQVDKVNIVILSSLHSPDALNLVEPLSNAQYSCEEIPKKWLESWTEDSINASFHLPLSNEYIAENFSISTPDQTPTDYPINLIQDAHGSVWYKKDMKFQKPTAYIRYVFVIPQLITSAINSVMMDLFIDCLNQKLGEECYPAYFAEIFSSIKYDHHSQFHLKLEGFNDKLPLMLENVVKCIKYFVIEKDLFENMKSQLVKDYFNHLLKPQRLASTLMFHILDRDRFSKLDLFNALSEVSLELMQTFIENLWQSIYLEALYQGNIMAKDVMKMHERVKEILNSQPLDPKLIPKLKICKLPNKFDSLRVASFNNKDVNSVIHNYYESLPLSIENLCHLNLFTQNIKEPLFDCLRTKHQLGYDVDCYLNIYHNLLSFRVQVVYSSEKFTFKDVTIKIDEFIIEFLEKHLKEENSEFKEQVESLIAVKTTPDVNLEEEVDRNWQEIINRRYVFDHLVQEVTFLRSVRHKDYKKWINSCFMQSPKLSIQVVGKNETNEYVLNELTTSSPSVNMNYIGTDADLTIHDIDKFKNGLSFVHSS